MGDGGFGMTVSELSTAVQHNINTITIVMNNKSWGAEKAYQRDLNKFSKFLESIAIDSLESISEEKCSAWVADLFQNDVSARSIQRHISSAKGFFSYMKKIGLVQSSPFELINSPKSPNHLPNILSPEEVSQLLNFKPKNSQDKRDFAIIELIYSSGLRVSEAVNSNLSDFEDNNNFFQHFFI